METIGDVLQSTPALVVEDSNLCALWKPPGWTVSVNDDVSDLMNLQDVPDMDGDGLQGWLADKLGQQYPIAIDRSAAHGLLHRLDRDTSGLILWAKSYTGYYKARLHFAAGNVKKQYICLCCGHLAGQQRFLKGPLLELPTKPGQPWACISVQGKPARTEILRVEHLENSHAQSFSLVQLRLHTGRRHQIRVHLAHEGHPLVQDAIYGGTNPAWCPRIFLHAFNIEIKFEESTLKASLPLPPDLYEALNILRPTGGASGAMQELWLRNSSQSEAAVAL